MEPITLTIAILYVADRIISQLIIDEGFNPIKKLFFPKKRYIDLLQNILNSTIIAFQEKYPPQKDQAHYRFYYSKILFEYLSILTLFKKHGIDLEKLINEFKKNPNIEVPNETQLSYFFGIFVKLAKEDAKLKKLYINENYKAEIFSISEFITDKLSPFLDEQSSFKKNYNQWSKFTGFEFKYEINDEIADIIYSVRSIITKEKSIVRILGLSGIGKTRMVFEVFNDNVDWQDIPSISKSQITYCDYGPYPTDVMLYLDHNYNKERQIIIVDNCCLDAHEEIEKIVKRKDSKISVITVDFEIENQGSHDYFILKNDFFKDIIEKIIKTNFPNRFTDTEIRRIVEFTDGFPQMAVLLAQSNDMEINVSNFLSSNLQKKLVWGRKEQDDKMYQILLVCSVFTSLGIKNEAAKEAQYVAKNLCSEPTTWEKFYQTCEHFNGIGIIEYRGNRLLVKPNPLALRLAYEWWKAKPCDETLTSVLTKVLEIGLGEKMFDRFSKLNSLPEAQNIATKLLGDDGVFRYAEVMNSELGSRLFRSLSVVNPVLSMHVLEDIFSEMSKQDLLKIEKGRRNIIWALEHLCFNKKTFSQASFIMLKFAIAENETWGNNATNQFLHLFQIHLAGTESSLRNRIDFLENCFKSNDIDIIELALKAMGKGLVIGHFSRSMGSEKQGSKKPLQDYQPQITEIIEYRNYIINKLKAIIIGSNYDRDIINLAVEQIIMNVKNSFSFPDYRVMYDTLIDIHDFIKENRIKIFKELKQAYRLVDKTETDAQEKLKSAITKYTPSDIEMRLKLIVSIPGWSDFEKGENGEYIDHQYLNAIAFAEEIIREEIKIDKYLPILMQGEQQQGFNFGEKLSSLQNNRSLIMKSIDVLSTISKEKQSPEFLAGLISGVSKNKVLRRELIKKIRDTDSICHQLFYITRMCDFGYNDVIKLFDLINKHSFPIIFFLTFKYGSFIRKFSSSQIINICSKITEYGIEGKQVALDLINTYCFTDDKNWQEIKEFAKKLLENDNLLLKVEQKQHPDFYQWERNVSKILDNKENQFAKTISTQIIEYCNHDTFSLSADIYLEKILNQLFDKYFNVVWDIFKEAIIGKYFPLFFNLSTLIGPKNSSMNRKEGFLIKGDLEVIINWCKKNTPLAVTRISLLLPSDNLNDEMKNQWHPFMKKIIDNFGHIEDVQNSISSNIGSFSCVGSSIPYYKSKLNLFETLLNHEKIEIQNWAKEMTLNFKKRIEREKISNEELYL